MAYINGYDPETNMIDPNYFKYWQTPTGEWNMGAQAPRMVPAYNQAQMNAGASAYGPGLPPVPQMLPTLQNPMPQMRPASTRPAQLGSDEMANTNQLQSNGTLRSGTSNSRTAFNPQQRTGLAAPSDTGSVGGGGAAYTAPTAIVNQPGGKSYTYGGSQTYEIPQPNNVTGNLPGSWQGVQNTPFNPLDAATFWAQSGPWAWQDLQNYVKNYMINSGAGFQNQVNNMQNYLSQYSPQSATAPLYQLLSQMSQNPLEGNPTLGAVGNNMNWLATQGYANEPSMSSTVQPLNAQGLGSTGAAQNLLGQLAGGQGVSSPEQQQIQQQLMQLIQGGGLTPEYVQAARELYLQPQQESVTGRLNQLAGGGAELSSPAYQESLRRNERDFMNQLLMSGQQNLGQYLNQGMQAGAQPFQQGGQIAGQMGNLGLGQLGQAGQNYGNVAGLELARNTNLTQNTMAPYQFGQQQQQMQGALGSNLLSQLLGSQNSLAGLLNQNTLGNAGMYGSLINNLTGQSNAQLMQQRAADIAAQIARSGAIGGAAQTGLNAIMPWIQGMITGNSGGGEPSTYPGWLSDILNGGGYGGGTFGGGATNTGFNMNDYSNLMRQLGLMWP